jgi:hypothetical protein
MKTMCKRITIILTVVIIALTCTACGSNKTMAIANVDEAANTFDLLDTGTQQKLAYSRLIVNGNEVVDWLCTGVAGSKAVVFATQVGQIVRDGNKTTYSGQCYTTDAKLEYELKDGTLTVIGMK